MSLRTNIEDMIEKMFDKMMEKYLRKTSTSISSGKVPVVGTDTNSNPIYNTSSITSSELAKLSGASSLSGSIYSNISSINSNISSLKGRVTPFYRESSVAPSTSWKYTGPSITIPANCVVYLKIVPNFNNALPSGSFLSTSTSSHNIVNRITADGQGPTDYSDAHVASGYFFTDYTQTFYCWAKWEETHSTVDAMVRLYGFYIQMY